MNASKIESSKKIPSIPLVIQILQQQKYYALVDILTGRCIEIFLAINHSKSIFPSVFKIFTFRSRS